MKQTVAKSIVIAILFSLATAKPALAYIDPGTGGMLFQALAIVFALFSSMALVFSRQIRMIFARVKRVLRRTPENDSQQAQETPSPVQDEQQES